MEKYLKYKNKYNKIKLKGGSDLVESSSDLVGVPFFNTKSPRIPTASSTVIRDPSELAFFNIKSPRIPRSFSHKWLVLDVDECLYSPSYTDSNGTHNFVDSFINIHKVFTEKYLDSINSILNKTPYTIDTLIDLIKKLNNGSNSIIGLFILLKQLNIPFSMTDYHNTMLKYFPYNKINKNNSIHEGIARAKAKNMKIAIFSNGSYPHIMKCLERLELKLNLFDYVSCLDFIAPTVITDQKPAKDSFIKLQNEINAQPSDIYFLDDSDKNCIGAKKLGWNVVYVNPDNIKISYNGEELDTIININSLSDVVSRI